MNNHRLLDEKHASMAKKRRNGKHNGKHSGKKHNGKAVKDGGGAYSPETRLIWGKSYTPKWDYSHHVVPPLSSSSTFRLTSTRRGAQGFVEFAHHADDFTVRTKAPIYIYDRLGEPNKDLLEENLAMAEQGECAVTFATGMAAVSGVCGILLGSGSEIIAHKILYGCTYSLLTNWLPRFGIKARMADLTRPGYEAGITPKTRVIYFESPINPHLRLVDMKRLVGLVRRENARRPKDRRIVTIIDNTFATPFCQRPIEQGIDLVVHSLTKDIGGFGTDMGGAVMGARRYESPLMLFRKDFGAVLSPKSAWPLLVYGLPTLAIRMKRQQETALKVARFLARHRRVEQVFYPGLPSFPQRALARRQMRCFEGKFAPGSMIYFLVKCHDKKSAERFIDRIAKQSYTVTLAVSLGQIRTLIENPFTMTHSSLPASEKTKEGVDPHGIRLSIGLEEPEDIIADLDRALR